MGPRLTRSDHSGKVVLEEVEEEGQQLEFLPSNNGQPGFYDWFLRLGS